MSRVPFQRSRCLAAAGAVLLAAQTAFALNPALDVSQYAHATWRVRDGFASDVITAVTQTADGYLWVGTDSGLMRFDGVRAVPWQPPSNQPLPSPTIVSLLAGRDGSLWIGTTNGLATWKDGRLTPLDDLGQSHVARMIEDRAGVVWVVAARLRRPPFVLCAIERGRARCFGANDGLRTNVLGVYEDRRGTLWAGTADGVWQWRPEPRRFHQLTAQANGMQGFAEGGDGDLLMGMAGGVRQLREGRATLKYPVPDAMRNVPVHLVLRDRDGGIWMGTPAAGLVHVHHDVADVFTETDGLSGDAIVGMFEDREGSVWVATREGLDRFRDAPAVVVSARQGLASSEVQSVLASQQGGIWLGTAAGLNRLDDRGISFIRAPGLRRPVYSLFEDRRGRIWASTLSSVGYLDGDRFVAAPIPAGLIRGIVEDSQSLWIINQESGLYQLSSDNTVIRHVPWTSLHAPSPAVSVAADRTQPGVWLGFADAVIHVIDGNIRASYGRAGGLGDGVVHHLHVDRSGTVWAATETGVIRLRDGRLASLAPNDGLPCAAASWIVEDAQSFWIGMACGLVRIARPDIDAWAAAVDARRPVAAVHPTIFGTADGIRLYRNPIHFTEPAAVAADGRLWFMSPNGVRVLDPNWLPSNAVPPPVHIERLTADRQTYDLSAGANPSVRLPALTGDLRIDYTALSFAAPEKVRFRYKLEGRDLEWQNVGDRRQAFYTDLRPRTYRFRVAASNNSGVWNDAGAAVDFTVAPAYYQTTWFIALSAVLVVALAWAGHRIRLRIVETHEREISALNERLMNAQEQERIRIAGELHDGVMQQMLAVTMMLGTAKRRSADNPEVAANIEKAQEKLIQAGTEIRQLSHDLHPPALQEAGLPQAVRAYCEQFSAACGIPVACEADDGVHDLSRGAALALFRIMQEALGNAAKHAAPRSIAVRLTRSNGLVSLVVADDGAGFDGSRLGTSGGLGLIMMRERASQLNGKFEFDSAPGKGTTIRVSIPFR